MNKAQTIIFTIFAFLFSFSTLADENMFSGLIFAFGLNHWIIKLLPMLLLIVFSIKQVKSKKQLLFVGGLIFSTLGDFLLAYNGVHWFIYGLAAFLLAHLFYLYSFLPIEDKNRFGVALYIFYGIVMLTVLFPKLGNLEMPVLLYMIVLLSMGVSTLLSKQSNRWLILGGISFVISDSLLGMNKFHTQFAYSHLLIIVSYYFAQFALVKGIFAPQSGLTIKQ